MNKSQVVGENPPIFAEKKQKHTRKKSKTKSRVNECLRNLNGTKLKKRIRKKPPKKLKNDFVEQRVIPNRRHLIVDYSNISISASTSAFAFQSPDPSRICDQSLAFILNQKPEDVAYGLRVVATSFTVENEQPRMRMKKCWESAGFLVRSCDRRKGKQELFVDEFLHAQAMDMILDQENKSFQNTLVLLHWRWQ
jgi:hypothetical protein